MQAQLAGLTVEDAAGVQPEQEGQQRLTAAITGTGTNVAAETPNEFAAQLAQVRAGNLTAGVQMFEQLKATVDAALKIEIIKLAESYILDQHVSTLQFTLLAEYSFLGQQAAKLLSLMS